MIISLLIVLTSLSSFLQNWNISELSVSEGLSSAYVTKVIQSSDGYMFFGTQLGVDRYDGRDVLHVSMPDINPDLLSIRDLCEDCEGRIWILSDGGVCRLERGDYSASVTTYFGNSVPRRMVGAGKGEYLCFVCRDSSLCSLNIRTDSIDRIARKVVFMCSDMNNRLFFTDTSGHLYISGTNSGSIQRIIIPDPDKLRSSGMSFLSDGQPDWTRVMRLRIAGDRLFLATDSYSIILALDTYDTSVLNRQRMYDAIPLSEGGYLVATKGVSILDDSLAEILHIENDGNSELQDNFTNSLCKDREGGIWIGTRYHGIYHLSRNYSDLFILNFQLTNGKKGSYTKDFSLNQDGTVDVLTEHSGVFSYNPSTGLVAEKPGIKRMKAIKSVSFDDGSTYKIVNGIVVVDKKSCERRVIATPSKQNAAILASRDKNFLWIASSTAGLYRMDIRTETFEEEYTGYEDKEQGCAVTGITYDGNGFLWGISNKGLFRLDETNHSVRLYSEGDGFPKGGYTSAIRFLGDGKVYVGMLNGFLTFRPEPVSESFPANRIVFTDFQRLGTKGDRPFPKKPVSTDSIVIPYESNSFSLGVSDLSFAKPAVSSLQFRLLNLTDQWSNVEDERIVIANLQHGRYILQVRQSPDYPVCGSTADLEIKVLRHPFASIVALILYALLVAGAIIISIHLVRKKEREKALVENERTAAKNARNLFVSKVGTLSEVAIKIGTPLTMAKAIADSLQTRFYKSPDKSLVADVNLIARSIDNISSIINEFAGINSLENMPARSNPAECNIKDIVASVFRRYELSARKRGLAFELQLPRSAISASVDRTMFEKILSCLLSNAVKYSSSRYSMTLNWTDDTIIIIQTNDGEIIPLDLREKIFDPFYQLSTGGREHKSISGLGLHIGRTLAARMEGSLKMDDDKTINRFVLTIPVRHISDILTPSLKSLANKPTLKPVLLVADSNSDFLTFLSMQFGDSFTTVSFTDGRSAMNYLCTGSTILPNIVISDVYLPEISGIELCDYLKSGQQTCHIPVILYSSDESDSSQAISYKTGADMFVRKPFSMERLFDGINNLLEGRKRLKEHYGRSALSSFEQVASSNGARLISRLDDFISANVNIVSLSVEDMASCVNMSASNLQKKLKSLINMSPIEYLNDFRMNKAKKLLEDDSISILEVSIATGYDSQTYFTKVFKKHFGLSPREYRAKLIRK